MWLIVDEVLGYFGKRERSAVKAFDEFVNSGAPDSFQEAMQKDSIVIGSGGFKEWVYENFIDARKKSSKEIPIKDKQPRKSVNFREILSSAAFAVENQD